MQRCPGASDLNVVPLKATKTKPNKEDKRLTALYEDKEVASAYFGGLFAALYSICDSTVGPAIKHKCVNAILRMLYYSPPELLDVILKKHHISSLIGGMLKSRDLQILVNALQMAEILMQKLPEAFHVSFRREGVMHKIHDIAYVWSKEHLSGNHCPSAHTSPVPPDVKPQAPENPSQPARLVRYSRYFFCLPVCLLFKVRLPNCDFCQSLPLFSSDTLSNWDSVKVCPLL